jgi:hypothetical protein
MKGGGVLGTGVGGSGALIGAVNVKGGQRDSGSAAARAAAAALAMMA